MTAIPAADAKDNLSKPPVQRQASRRRMWGGRIGAILLGLVMAVLVLELAIRLLAPILPANIQSILRDVRVTPFTDQKIMPPHMLRADNYFGFVNIPGAVNELQVANSGVSFHITTKNWLDPESHVGFRVPSPDWEPRWPVDAVVVGDSFSVCFTEYPDCWVERLSTDYGLSIVNLAITATGTTSHLRVLNTFGLPYEPRMVIWQWYGNDYADDYWLAVISGEIEGEVLPGRPEPSSPLAGWLRDNLASYAILDAFSIRRFNEAVDPYYFEEGTLKITFGHLYLRRGIDMSTERPRFGWERGQESLRAARELLKEKGIELVIVLIPTKEEAYGKWTVSELGADGLAGYQEGRLMLLDFCKQENLRCFDVTSALVAHAEAGEQLYWPTDSHLSPQGNKVLAAELYQFLVQEKLVK